MHTLEKPTVVLGTLLLLLISVAAIADENLPITITNDNPGTILVTAYDMNLHPPVAIMKGQLINGFASVKISITPGATGYGHLSWTASTADTFSRRCGHRDRSWLQNTAVVHVYAKSLCN